MREKSRLVRTTVALSTLLSFATLGLIGQETPAPSVEQPPTSQPTLAPPQASAVGDPGERQMLPAPIVEAIRRGPPPDASDFKMKTETALVLLDISVRGVDGGFVSGLSKEKFRVWEDKVEQPIKVFSAQDVPVTVGLVVDNSGSVRPKKPEIVTSALTFVTQSNPKDEMFVVTFNDRVVMGLPDDTPFTGDAQLLRRALLSARPQGRTSLFDAVSTALDHLEKGKLDKKTLVLIGDGGDNMSDTTKEELMRKVESSLATIYTIGIYNPDDKDKRPGFMQELAKISGGEYFEPGQNEQLVSVCEKVAKDIRNRYTLGYSPSNRSFDGKIRRIKVVAAGEGQKQLKVRTRTHYLADAQQLSRETKPASTTR